MGLGDYLSGGLGLGGLGHDFSKYVLGQSDAAPGIAGAAGVNDPMQYDPTTGMWFDKHNGQYYQDPSGSAGSALGNPNVAQLTGANNLISQQLLANQGQDRSQQLAGFGGEQSLAHQLQAAAMGAGPSVAQTQLGIGQDALAAQMMSQAAGVSGPGALAAQLAAMRGTAAGQLGVNQQAALLRAQEAQQARTQLGSLYGNMAQQGQGMLSTDLGAGSNFANTAAGLAQGREQTEEDRQKANAQSLGQRLTSLSGGGSQAGATAAPMFA